MLRATAGPRGTEGVPYIIGYGRNLSTTGNVTENTLATVTIPANALGANGIIRIYSNWTFTNSANSKLMLIRYSGTGGTTFGSWTATTTSSTRDFRWIRNDNATNAQVGGVAGASPFGNSGSTFQTSSVDTTADTTLVFRAQNGNSGETITLREYSVEIIRLT